MDNLDREILNIIQTRFPIVSRPYQDLAEQVGSDESEVLRRVRALKSDGTIRRLGAIFDSRRLGYASTLVAAQVPAERLDEVGAIVSELAGVTHNYRRDHPLYTLWFTLITPSQQALDETLEGLRLRTGIREIYPLPALKLFKIRVDFDMTGERSKAPDEPSLNGDEAPLGSDADESGRYTDESGRYTDTERTIVRALQDDLPLVLEPYAEIAAELGIDEDELLATASRWSDDGVIRRFGAVLRHQRAGFSANAMGAWVVPSTRVDDVGPKMAAFSQVSHCYERPPAPGWPYNVFTMIHATSAKECREVARHISEATGVSEYALLYSTKEYKKTSMKYFAEEGH